MIVYDLTTTCPSHSYISLSPFEIHREPLVILAIADAAEFAQSKHDSFKGTEPGDLHEDQRQLINHDVSELEQEFRRLKDRYHRALVHRVLLFDYVPEKLLINLPEEVMTVPPPEKCKRTTLKTLMCDISSKLLADMTVLAKSIQESRSIDSPNLLRLSQNGHRPINFPELRHTLSRRNSDQTISSDTTENSSSRTQDRDINRTSAPMTRPDGKTSTKNSRPNTPNKPQSSSLTGSPVSQAAHTPGDATNPQRVVPSRLFSTNSLQEKILDRNSIQGFGSGVISERSKNLEKGRKFIVIGSLYMLAGRWTDAVRDIAEGANIAKSISDNLWYAKALENILVSMIMLAWCGLNFQIPQVCHTSLEKASSVLGTQEGKTPAQNRNNSLKTLMNILPELIDKILNTYTAAANKIGQNLSELPFSESVLRLSKLLTDINLTGGLLNDDVLKSAVLGTPLQTHSHAVILRSRIRPTRSEIVAILFQAFPSASSEKFSVVDRAMVLSCIASILSTLGFHRKKSLVIRELILCLTHALVHARTTGTTETGIHPAAGLSSLSHIASNKNSLNDLALNAQEILTGLDEPLGSLCQSYGILPSAFVRNSPALVDDSNEAIISRILLNAPFRSFGNNKMKIDILHLCINMSEALPDFPGVLRFSADLLRTIGSGAAPGPRSQSALPSMNREDQVMLVGNISRTLSMARNLGIKNLEAEYWDEFILRGIKLEPLPDIRRLILHRKSEILGVTTDIPSTSTNPFIYNPFLRNFDSTALESLLVADEIIKFTVTLQNPYGFDIDIESMTLESEGVDYQSAVQKSVLGPYRTQNFSISGTPKAPGQLKITGCNIKVRGCRKRRFPIFEDPWSPQRQVKIGIIGATNIFQSKQLSESIKNSSEIRPPKPNTLVFNIVKKQPIVVVNHTTPTHSAFMILEGEMRAFSVTFKNLSPDIPVDLLLFSFKDSTLGPLQQILKSRDSAAAELYECELILAHKQALRWRNRDDKNPSIAPGSNAKFDFEVLGKPGLKNATIQVDYAHLGIPVKEVAENFYTRQLNLPLTITVNSSVQLVGIDTLLLSRSLPRSSWMNLGILVNEQSSFVPDNYFLLQLDLRNAWTDQLVIRLNIKNGGSVEEEITAGKTKRFLLPIKRIFLNDTSASIPSLDPSHQRQFVVSADRIPDETARAKLEAFWYKEELLKIIHGTWSLRSNPTRQGNIELRSIKLTPKMVEAIRADDLAILLSCGSDESLRSVQYTDKFLELKVRIINKTSRPILPILRLQPSLHNQPLHLALDLSRRLFINGLLQQSLPLLPSSENIEVSFCIIALARGEYEINASIEESQMLQAPDECVMTKELEGTSGSKDINTIPTLPEEKKRRIWHSKNPLVLLVRDIDTDRNDT